MRYVNKSTRDLGDDFSLSPEHWLSTQTAAALSGDVLLMDLVQLVSEQVAPPRSTDLILDTSNAREGLIDIPIQGDRKSARTSAKKTAREGDVIFSRLRPYLRQVALLPSGISDAMGQSHFLCSTEFFVFRSRDNRNIAGLVAWFLSEPVQAIVCDAATGGHHPRINASLLLNAPVDKRYIDQKYCKRLDAVLAQHIKSQRELAILLRH